jgi:putative addiction module component (TIGR02574 family)
MATRIQRTAEDIAAEALQLEPLARAAVAKSLLDSLYDLSDEQYEQLWVEEAEARYADFEAGRTKAVDGDEVFARARARNR